MAGVDILRKAFAVQEQLYLLLRELSAKGKQIVIVSDTVANDLRFGHKGLEELIQSGTIVLMEEE